MSEQRLPVKLECGAVVADLLEQVSSGHANDLTPHQAGCPHCEATLSRLADSWRVIERLRADQVRPSPELLARVMRRIRSGVDDRQVELGGERGVTRVSLAVLTSLAFWAATAAPGVRQVFRAQLRDSAVDGPAGSSGRRYRLVRAANLRVELELSIHYGFSALVVAQEAGRAVTDTIREMTGLELTEVELTIADVG